MDFACLKGGQFVVIVLNEEARNLKTKIKKILRPRNGK